MFQSLSGFQVRCNKVLQLPSYYHKPWFQSLSGFQVRCNFNHLIREGVIMASFNPCRVFKCAATLMLMFPVSLPKKGFNPCRVFKCAATAEPCQDRGDIGIYVSIPVGFSSALQLNPHNPIHVGCCCFNPCRVFKCAATASFGSDWLMIGCCFNPCRVFKCAATSMSGAFLNAFMQFQSLSGFQVRCNLGDVLLMPKSSGVSIPVGFSSALQRLGPHPLQPHM